MSMAITFGKVGIYNEEFPFITSPDPLISGASKVFMKSLQGHVKYFRCCITTTTRSLATKLTYNPKHGYEIN